MVTEVPTGPEGGLRLVILGAIPKITVLLVAPETVTATPTLLNADRPTGTTATMLVSLQLVTEAAREPNVIELVPCVAPKPVPEMVTEVPEGPVAGLRLEISGPAVTVKATPLLATLATVTTTLPLVAPEGTVVNMAVLVQLLGAARVPLKVTVLVPWLAPKLPPDIFTDEVTGPAVGLRLVMVGAGVIEKLTWLLGSPNTTT